MQLNDMRSCLRFEKNLRSVEKVCVLALWSCASLHPRACSGVVRSSCLGVWFAELEVNGLPALDSRCDLDDSVVWRSFFRSERMPHWGSLEFCQWPRELEMQCRKENSSALCTHSSWWLLFETTFCKLFSVPSTFEFVFRNQWDKYFKTR